MEKNKPFWSWKFFWAWLLIVAGMNIYKYAPIWWNAMGWIPVIAGAMLYPHRWEE